MLNENTPQDLTKFTNLARYELNSATLDQASGRIIATAADTVNIFPNLVIPGTTYRLTLDNLANGSNVDVVAFGNLLGFASPGQFFEADFLANFDLSNRNSFYRLEFVFAGPSTLENVQLEALTPLDLAIEGKS